MVRVHVWISGRVQGVGFRAFVCQQAEYHRLTGWVRNVGDGRVESEAQGHWETVDGFLRDLEQGPSRSDVGQVEVTRVEPRNNESSFEVMY